MAKIIEFDKSLPERLLGITAQHKEIVKRIVNGSLDPTAVKRALQDIIEGKLSSSFSSPIPTDIVARVERQLAQYEEIGFSVSAVVLDRILANANVFVTLSATDRPLVTGFFGYAPEAINQIWSKVKLEGYNIVRNFNQDVPVRFASGMNPRFTQPQPRLVHFEPNSYQGVSPESALKQAKQSNVRLAGIEACEMLLVEPEWALEWNGTDHPYPNLSALQLAYSQDESWQYVPCLNRLDDDRQLRLSDFWDDYRNVHWSSPSVREC